MAKHETITTYKEAAAYIAKAGCGTCTHRPEDGKMFWRLSNFSADKIKDVLATFQESGFRVAAAPDEGFEGTLIGRMPGNGAYYIDVEFVYEEGQAQGDRPRIVLVRGRSDEPAKVKA